MAKTNLEQLFTMFAGLGENAGLGEFTTEEIQVGIREKQRAGQEFALFVHNGFRVQIGDFFRETGELTIGIPALPRPTLPQLREKFSWIREEDGIERDTSPECAVTLKLGTVLRLDEERIDGPEYERRIAPKLNIALGYQQAEWLVQHQDESPEFMALLGKVYIDFTGLVVALASGRRDFLCLDRGDGRCFVRWSWVGGGFSQGGRLAVSSK